MSLHIHLGRLYIELFVITTFNQFASIYIFPAVKLMLHPYEKGIITIVSFLMLSLGLSIRSASPEEQFWGLGVNEE